MIFILRGMETQNCTQTGSSAHTRSENDLNLKSICKSVARVPSHGEMVLILRHICAHNAIDHSPAPLINQRRTKCVDR